MYDSIETIEYNGCTIDVYVDDNAGDPFSEFDQMGTLVMAKGYNMPDSKAATYLDDENHDTFADAFNEHMEGERIAVSIWFRVGDYGSSGWRIGPTSAEPFDSDNACLYVTHEKLLDEYRVKIATPSAKERAMQVLKAELEQWRQWLQSEVYGYVAKDAQGKTISSVWGFYGDEDRDGYMLDEAKAEVDAYVTRQASQMRAALIPGL